MSYSTVDSLAGPTYGAAISCTKGEAEEDVVEVEALSPVPVI